MKKWFFGITLVVAAMFAGCNEDLLIDNNGDGITDVVDGYTVLTEQAPVLGTIYPDLTTVKVCSIASFPLTAGQYIDAGTVEIFNDATNLYINFNTLGTFGTLHLWVGTDLLNVPKNHQGVPNPGHFPFKFNATGLQHYTFIIPLKDYNYICGTQLYFMAHAEVSGDMDGDGDDDGGQTAFGGNNGVNIEEPGRWYFYDTFTVQCCTFEVPGGDYTFQTAYAKPPKVDAAGNLGYVFVGKPSKTNKSNPEGYAPLNLTQNRWGWAIQLKSTGEFTYDVWAGAGLNNTANGVNVGKATVNFDGSHLTVTYNLTGGAILEEVHVYSSDIRLWTIAPGQYGHTAYFEPEDQIGTYTVTLPVDELDGDGTDVWVSLHAVVGIPQ